MTDVVVEKILTEQFLSIGAPYIREKKVDGETVYENVSLPNRSFERPLGMWFEVWFIPGNPNQVEIGTSGRSRWTGIMQINICYPKGAGTDGPDMVFDAISKAFVRSDIVGGVRIKSVRRSSARIADDYYSVPVSVSWEADLDR